METDRDDLSTFKKLNSQQSGALAQTFNLMNEEAKHNSISDSAKRISKNELTDSNSNITFNRRSSCRGPVSRDEKFEEIVEEQFEPIEILKSQDITLSEDSDHEEESKEVESVQIE
jgi:hypothetical protein